MRVSYIELCGEKHPLCFSLSATEDIIEEFGSVEAMGDIITGNDMLPRIRAVDTVLTILLRAGRAYCSAMGMEMPAPLRCRPADVIDITSGDAVSAIFDTMKKDGERSVEAVSKNAEPTQA